MKWNFLFILLGILSCSAQEIEKQSYKKNLICTETESKSKQNDDSILTKTCTFYNYKLISKEYPDYKGRYSYEYVVFKTVGNRDIKIKNSELFKNNKELELIINKKIKEQYESDMKIADLKECMSYIVLRQYKIDEMGIYFDGNNEMYFSVNFGLASACFNVSRTLVTLNESELQRFFK
jgi:hypothetical protein